MKALKTFLAVLLAATFLLTGCGLFRSAKEDAPLENQAVVGVSPNFDSRIHRRLAVLPFFNDGRDGQDAVLGDKFALHCMEIGFMSVERSLLQSVLASLNIAPDGEFSLEDLHKIRERLQIDMIVVGTASYVDGPGGVNELWSEAVKFIALDSGEVLISAYCERIEGRSISRELAEAVGAAVHGGGMKDRNM